MSRTRVGAGMFGPGPGQAMAGTRRVNLGTFGPGEDQRKAREKFAANSNTAPTSEELNRLEERRRADDPNYNSNNVNGMLPSWRGFFDALGVREMRAGNAGMNFKVRQGTPFGLPPSSSPQMNGLNTASRRRR